MRTALPQRTRTTPAPRMAAACLPGLGLALALLAPLTGCDRRSDRTLWPDHVKRSLRYVSAEQLTRELMARGQRAAEAEPPRLRRIDLAQRQGVRRLVQLMADVNPADLSQVTDAAGRAGLTPQWHGIRPPPDPAKPNQRDDEPTEWVLTLTGAAGGESAANGQYLMRWPPGEPVALAVPAGYDGTGLTEAAVRTFLSNRRISLLAIQTPATLPADAQEEEEAARANVYAELTAGAAISLSGVCWVDLATLPEAPSTAPLLELDALAARGPTVAGPLPDAGLAVVSSLLEQRVAVVAQGLSEDMPTLTLPPLSLAVARACQQGQRSYILLAVPANVSQDATSFSARLSKALGTAKVAPGPLDDRFTQPTDEPEPSF